MPSGNERKGKGKKISQLYNVYIKLTSSFCQIIKTLCGNSFDSCEADVRRGGAFGCGKSCEKCFVSMRRLKITNYDIKAPAESQPNRPREAKEKVFGIIMGNKKTFLFCALRRRQLKLSSGEFFSVHRFSPRAVQTVA